MATKVIGRSESYEKYFHIERDGVNHVAVRDKENLGGEGDGFLSCGMFSNAEDFETCADVAAEESRCMLMDLLNEGLF